MTIKQHSNARHPPLKATNAHRTTHNPRTDTKTKHVQLPRHSKNKVNKTLTPDWPVSGQDVGVRFTDNSGHPPLMQHRTWRIHLQDTLKRGSLQQQDPFAGRKCARVNLPFLSNRLECSASYSCLGGTLTQAPYSLHCTASNQNMSLLEPLSMWYHTVNIFPWTNWQRNCACVSNTPELVRNNMERFAERITTDNSSSNKFVSGGREPVLPRSPRPDRCNRHPGVHSYERNEASCPVSPAHVPLWPAPTLHAMQQVRSSLTMFYTIEVSEDLAHMLHSARR